MAGREDGTILKRSMTAKLTETLLLVLAVALGVGAASAGLSLVIQSNRLTDELVNSPQYREITVTPRSSAEDMERPAVELSDEEIKLSEDDLLASLEAPDVTWSYLSEQSRFFMGVRNFGGPPQPNNESGDQGNDTQSAEEPPTENHDPEREAFMERMQELAGEISDQPEAQLEELYGYSVSAEFFQAWNLQTLEGSLFTQSDSDRSANLMVVGSEIAATLFEDGVALDRRVQVFDRIYTISGVLEETGTVLDNQVYTPVSTQTAMIMPGMKVNRTLHFSVENPGDLDRAAQQLQSWFDSEYGSGSVALSIPREEAMQTAQRNGRLGTLILILALSGLLIASVNVSNILLSRALRQQRMIGILKALGASRQRIFQLFFNEALFISLAGTLVGTLISLALAPLLATSMGYTGVSWTGMAAGVLISLVLTLALTLLPAGQAARIMPAEAIRTE